MNDIKNQTFSTKIYIYFPVYLIKLQMQNVISFFLFEISPPCLLPFGKASNFLIHLTVCLSLFLFHDLYLTLLIFSPLHWQVFIDTTGDGRLGVEAGCKWRQVSVWSNTKSYKRIPGSGWELWETRATYLSISLSVTTATNKRCSLLSPQGREAQSEFNESLAMLTADTATEGTSLAFTAR